MLSTADINRLKQVYEINCKGQQPTQPITVALVQKDPDNWKNYITIKSADAPSFDEGVKHVREFTENMVDCGMWDEEYRIVIYHGTEWMSHRSVRVAKHQHGLPSIKGIQHF